MHAPPVTEFQRRATRFGRILRMVSMLESAPVYHDARLGSWRHYQRLLPCSLVRYFA